MELVRKSFSYEKSEMTGKPTSHDEEDQLDEGARGRATCKMVYFTTFGLRTS